MARGFLIVGWIGLVIGVGFSVWTIIVGFTAQGGPVVLVMALPGLATIVLCAMIVLGIGGLLDRLDKLVAK